MATGKWCTKCNKPITIVRMIKVADRSYKATCENCGIKFVSGVLIKCKTCGAIIKGNQGVYPLDCPSCGGIQSHWLPKTPIVSSSSSTSRTPSAIEPVVENRHVVVQRELSGNNRGRRGPLFTVLGVFLLFAILGGVFVSSLFKSGPPAKYSVYLQGHASETLPPDGWGTGNWGTGGSVQQIGPADLRVYFTVQNVGKGSGSPTCQVTAGNPSSPYYGFDTVYWNKPIPAGRQISDYYDITITNNGAQYVTQVSVKC